MLTSIATIGPCTQQSSSRVTRRWVKWYTFLAALTYLAQTLSPIRSKNKNHGYNSCIHDYRAMIKDTCYARHHIM